MSESRTNITGSPAPGPLPTTTSLPASVRPRRVVDLGREDALVPWAEWFHRASAMMDHVVSEGMIPAMPRTFRVTLTDGRPFAVFSVKTHIAHGKCSDSGRWCEPGANATTETCDVITGYSLVGTAHDGRPCVLTVPPAEIASVECVLVPEGAVPQAGGDEKGEKKDAEIPFGFAAFSKRNDQPELVEEDEPTPFLSVI